MAAERTEREKEQAKKTEKRLRRNPNSVTRDIVTRKVRLFPTIEQKEILRRAVGTYRWVYNRVVSLIKSKQCKMSKAELRKRCVNKDAFALENSWALDMPYEFRDQAMTEAIGAFSSNIAKKKKGKTRLSSFDVKLKKKRAGFGEIKILARAWTKHGLHPTCLKMGKIESSEPIPDSLYADTNIYCENFKWYMTVPYKRESETLCAEDREGKICSVDPGVRVFATVYDPLRDKCFRWGAGDSGRIARLQLWMDDLASRMKEMRAAGRYRARKALNRMRARVHNLVNELHKKFALWLRSNYEFVFLPAFNAHDMCSKTDKTIAKQTKRLMLTLAHARFRIRLADRIQVITVTEQYTSKTCSACGTIKSDLRGAKLFKCDQCGMRADRDCNGAKNIFLKAMLDIRSVAQVQQLENSA